MFQTWLILSYWIINYFSLSNGISRVHWISLYVVLQEVYLDSSVWFSHVSYYNFTYLSLVISTYCISTAPIQRSNHKVSRFNLSFYTPLHSVVIVPQHIASVAFSTTFNRTSTCPYQFNNWWCASHWRIELRYYNCLPLGSRNGALMWSLRHIDQSLSLVCYGEPTPAAYWIVTRLRKE